ncbi:hypothetical protein IW261DRAFT_1030753 [Armillaria novae-zelandiae]|uniref:Uncharacterized protein n=1 Tax=Armillaria novae-zelandiae TaxID=153914 RepID=A0AA39UKD2_9AGAR|nr:hypothetical protein IW261DRAFT_1030753 [Armillaria novae-zelandiae]
MAVLCPFTRCRLGGPPQIAMEGKYPGRVDVILKCLFCIQLALLQGLHWIVQALKHTHFFLSVLKCCLINSPAHLRYGLSQFLLVITTNLIWWTVLRQVRKSLMKIDIFVIDSLGFPSKLAEIIDYVVGCHQLLLGDPSQATWGLQTKLLHE